MTRIIKAAVIGAGLIGSEISLSFAVRRAF